MSVPVGITVPKLLPVTGTFAPAFAAYWLLLSLRVSLSRATCNTFIGTSGEGSSSSEKPATAEDQQALLINSRCHMNFVENVPLALLVATFVETNGGNRRVLAYSLAALLCFRVAHVEFGLKAKDAMGWGRPFGAFGTLSFVTSMSAYSAWLVKSYWGY